MTSHPLIPRCLLSVRLTMPCLLILKALRGFEVLRFVLLSVIEYTNVIDLITGGCEDGQEGRF